MSPLDQVIPGEIRDDRLARTLRRLASDGAVRCILEEGSSSGDGSTVSLVAGARENPSGPPEIHCLELSEPRHRKLAARYDEVDFVHCHRLSAVHSSRLLGEAEIQEFCRGWKPWLRRRSAGRYRQWLGEDRSYARESGVDGNGIQAVKERFDIGTFDLVLLDGSEFAGPAVLDDVYGARHLVLDDIRSIKNHGNYRRLRDDPTYEMAKRSWWLRNGFAVFSLA